jgi:ATP-binding cassette subfamily F protein 3
MGQKHRQAKDREKKLERIEETRIERPREAKRISLRISAGTPSGKRVLALRDLAVGFDRPLITCPDLDLYRDEKVAIIGPNGCGKTSLLRTITGDLRPVGGSVEQGHGVKTAVFTQTQEGLHDDRTVIETLLGRTNLTISEARGLLGSFLFSGDDVDKKTKNLSGGERSRVALALLSLMDGNLLMLDEPTNHLDLASQEILEAALLAYEGTILLVSHDRALLEAVTTRVWLVEDGGVVTRSYGYAEYRRRLFESEREDAARPHAEAKRPQVVERAKADRPKKVDKYEQKRLGDARRAIEERIESLEAELAAIECGLVEASGKGDAGRIASLGMDHARVKAALEANVEEWGALPALSE